MKRSTSLALSTCLLLASLGDASRLRAAPVPYVLQITDVNGNNVSGEVVQIGTSAPVTLTSGSPATVAGVRFSDMTSALSGPSLTYYDPQDGTGQITLLYAAARYGEAHFVLTVSKTGVTFANFGKIGINFTIDAAKIASVGGPVASVTAPVTVTGTVVASNVPTVPQIAAGILASPAQPIVTNSLGYVTTSNPATGGSAVTEATIWAYGTRTLTAQADTPGTATMLNNYARRTDPMQVGSYAAGQDPAALLLANTLFSNLANHQMGKYTYNPATHSIQLYKDDGVTALGSPMTLTLDGSNNITNRM